MKKLSIALLLFGLIGSLNAQVMKNDWLMGGGIKFASNKVAEIKTSMFEFSPNVGYFLANNFAGGLRASINSVKLEDEDAISSTLVSPFLRYYFLPGGNKVNFMLDGSFGFGSAVFAAIATDAPSAAARRAIARPIPRDPPVIKILLPWRFPEIVITFRPFLFQQPSWP
jgi:hypothetical protein